MKYRRSRPPCARGPPNRPTCARPSTNLRRLGGRSQSPQGRFRDAARRARRAASRADRSLRQAPVVLVGGRRGPPAVFVVGALAIGAIGGWLTGAYWVGGSVVAHVGSQRLSRRRSKFWPIVSAVILAGLPWAAGSNLILSPDPTLRELKGRNRSGPNRADTADSTQAVDAARHRPASEEAGDGATAGSHRWPDREAAPADTRAARCGAP